MCLSALAFNRLGDVLAGIEYYTLIDTCEGSVPCHSIPMSTTVLPYGDAFVSFHTCKEMSTRLAHVSTETV